MTPQRSRPQATQPQLKREEVLAIIEKRIKFAETKQKEAVSAEMDTFWDGQIRCAQALLNEIAKLDQSKDE